MTTGSYLSFLLLQFSFLSSVLCSFLSFFWPHLLSSSHHFSFISPCNSFVSSSFLSKIKREHGLGESCTAADDAARKSRLGSNTGLAGLLAVETAATGRAGGAVAAHG
jgi:hypothetical protein